MWYLVLLEDDGRVVEFMSQSDLLEELNELTYNYGKDPSIYLVFEGTRHDVAFPNPELRLVSSKPTKKKGRK